MRHFVMKILLYLGVSSLGLLFSIGAYGILPSANKDNLRAIHQAALAANGFSVDGAVFNPDCQTLKHNSALVKDSPRRTYKEATAEEKTLFRPVGVAFFPVPGGDKDKGNYSTASLTACDCVVTTAAHPLFDESGTKLPGVKENGRMYLPGGKSSGFNFLDIELGTERLPRKLTEYVNDWAVIILRERPTNNILPLKIPSDDESYVGPRMVSVANNGDLSGGDTRRISQCEAVKLSRNYFPDDKLVFNSCSFNSGGSGSPVVSMNGPHDFIFRQMNAGDTEKSDSSYTEIVPDDKHFNFAVPVRGAFRRAIIDACNKCTGGTAWQEFGIAKEN